MPLEGPERLSIGLWENHDTLDRPLKDTLRYFLGRLPDMEKLGEYTGKIVYELTYRVDKQSQPIHIMWDVRGNRVDVSWLDPMERLVVRELIEDYGVNRYPFSGELA